MKFRVKNTLFVSSFLFAALQGCAGSSGLDKHIYSQGMNPDTVRAQKFDTGRMWTFDNPPVEYFEKTYGFHPSQQWLDNVRKSALRFSTYCSASFVSADGLVMTNHHCGRESVSKVSREGEDLGASGFYAEKPEDERKVPGLFVDQLIDIRDVTKEVQAAIEKAESDKEKVIAEKKICSEIEKKEKKDGYKFSVVKLYQGGQYSLYTYKTYSDVRLVFSPENQLGFFGGDYDNFTYPRYNLDFNFFRVYDENGKPLKTENYFRWSKNGASEGDAVFVVGNPGRTNRLNTLAQLEYYRDISYPAALNSVNQVIDIYKEEISNHPEKKRKLENELFSISNSQKVYSGVLKGLNDPFLMARKADFERSFKAAVMADENLKGKYECVWDEIRESKEVQRKYADVKAALNTRAVNAPEYLSIAKDVVELAGQMKLPENKRQPKYSPDSLDNTKKSIFPSDFDESLNAKLLLSYITNMVKYLGEDDEIYMAFTGNRKGKDAVDYILRTSQLTSSEKILEFLKKNPDEILNSNDPFIAFLNAAEKRMGEIAPVIKDASNREAANGQLLGRALFEVYGHSIPPDATFTLRISDGIVKGYDYNGTIAPVKTTYYGLYERNKAFNKSFPFDLPEKWSAPPAEFNLETPMNFISTNDIIGGNSGSPVINKDAEIVGLAFDGNIESLPANFIFSTEANRTVSVDSEGMVEAIQDMYKAKRLSDELQKGMISESLGN